MFLNAKTVNSATIDDGGSGLFKAEMVGDDKLKGYTIYRPKALKAAAEIEGQLPVILFCNGACARNSKDFAHYLTELASHGYVVLAIGEWNNREYDPMKENPPLNDKQSLINVDDAHALLKASQWLEKENNNKKSEYFQTVNTNCMASIGQSCGGLQSLIIGTSGDKRIRTVVALNSGANNPGDKLDKMLVKDDLKKLSVPTIYIIGGKKDIAYENAIDDYRRINHIPIAIASHTVSGHGATYRDLHGGTFADMTIAWLDWQLKGKTENENIFRYGMTEDKFNGWKVYSKNIGIKPIIISFGQSTDNKEEIKYDAFGNIESYSKVTVPSMTVCLPDKDKATGTAVVICPGGALVSLAWESEFMNAARWLNAHGIAAIGVKYRLRQQWKPAPGGLNHKMLGIADVNELPTANANPAGTEVGDKALDNASHDLAEAIRQVKMHAPEWHINPQHIGVMGFSAGGAVSSYYIINSDSASQPAFFASVYGPSLIDVEIPQNAPRLFIAVHADHPNVAAGCLAFFLKWKKANLPAEMHIYDTNTGGLFGAGPKAEQLNTPAGSWKEDFYSWLVANKFTK